ncbi:hypothetical protein JNM87_01165 [Candidatus Saccharibacteria bacterium]|nr:hypothetical protein [Candidatus Saccharibacteria bacterium]
MSAEKIRLGLDHDDVQVCFIPGIVAWSHREYGTSPRVEDYRDDWAEWWGIPREAAIERRNAFWASEASLSFLPLEGAVESLRRLADDGLFGCEVEMFVLTSRPAIAQAVTRAALDKHFPGLFSAEQVYFAGFFDGNFGPNAHLLSKGQQFVKHGARIIVDDAPVHVNGSCVAGVPLPLHLDVYGRHREAELHPSVRTALDWQGLLVCMRQAGELLQATP